MYSVMFSIYIVVVDENIHICTAESWEGRMKQHELSLFFMQQHFICTKVFFDFLELYVDLLHQMLQIFIRGRKGCVIDKEEGEQLRGLW